MAFSLTDKIYRTGNWSSLDYYGLHVRFSVHLAWSVKEKRATFSLYWSHGKIELDTGGSKMNKNQMPLPNIMAMRFDIVPALEGEGFNVFINGDMIQANFKTLKA